MHAHKFVPAPPVLLIDCALEGDAVCAAADDKHEDRVFSGVLCDDLLWCRHIYDNPQPTVLLQQVLIGQKLQTRCRNTVMFIFPNMFLFLPDQTFHQTMLTALTCHAHMCMGDGRPIGQHTPHRLIRVSTSQQNPKVYARKAARPQLFPKNLLRSQAIAAHLPGRHRRAKLARH